MTRKMEILRNSTWRDESVLNKSLARERKIVKYILKAKGMTETSISLLRTDGEDLTLDWFNRQYAGEFPYFLIIADGMFGKSAAFYQRSLWIPDSKGSLYKNLVEEIEQFEEDRLTCALVPYHIQDGMVGRSFLACTITNAPRNYEAAYLHFPHTGDTSVYIQPLDAFIAGIHNWGDDE